MSLFQDPLFPPSKTAEITIDESHTLVKLTEIIKWSELTILAMDIREASGKKNTGPITHYRCLLGAVALMAMRKINFRQAEDLIANYVPARYLCGLMESDWKVDHVTIFDFTKMLGPNGMEELNKKILGIAEDHELIDTKEVMSDTTAQEAMIPYPNEVGLMNRYMDLVKKGIGKLGGKFQSFKKTIKETWKEVKGLVRNSHLFAKTVEEKRKVGKKLYHVIEEVQTEIAGLLSTGSMLTSKGGKEIARLNRVMEALLPQMLHFLETGFVANKKIIHLQMDKLYSIVRGKAGKKVEFGLKWGINRIAGGFVQGFLMGGVAHASDRKFCIEAVKKHIETFGRAPNTYGFDRGGYSKANIKKLKKLKVKHVGVAPIGNAAWDVSETKEKHIKRERAQVEGCIGTIKRSKYGFNKPDAKSIEAMVSYGHRAILGFNMNKLVKMVGAEQKLGRRNRKKGLMKEKRMCRG